MWLRLHKFAAALEGATGIALIASPPIVADLLLGHTVAGVGIALGRVAGIGLLSLGIACWPARDGAGLASSRALITYNLLVALYLFRLGIRGSVGILLWPAVTMHSVLAILLLRDGLASTRESVQNGPA